MINNFGKKKIVIASGIILTVSFCAYIFSFSKNQKPPAEKIETVAAYTDKLSGFSADTKMTADYLTNDKESMQDVYAVQYTLSSSDFDYIDIELQVNKNLNKINAEFSGLPSAAKISLVLGQNPYHSAVPVDWAGRLTLSSHAIDFTNIHDICLKIEGLHKDKTSTLCHNAAQPTLKSPAIKSNEGQVPS